ncbi:MAG: hypothetical protein R2862_10250 [Thermoanaerobaculia bacterium]
MPLLMTALITLSRTRTPPITRGTQICTKAPSLCDVTFGRSELGRIDPQRRLVRLDPVEEHPSRGRFDLAEVARCGGEAGIVPIQVVADAGDHRLGGQQRGPPAAAQIDERLRSAETEGLEIRLGLGGSAATEGVNAGHLDQDAHLGSAVLAGLDALALRHLECEEGARREERTARCSEDA